MVKRMRLPLLIAVVVIVALLLPGPAIVAGPDVPRVTGVSSLINGIPGTKLAYGAKGDPKTGMVTFVGRVYNTSPSNTFLNVRLRARVPDGTNLVESWCSLPGTGQTGAPGPDGWIEWSRVQQTRGPAGSTSLCGFTVSGWDGKSTLLTGWQASWDSKTGVSSWIDEFGAKHYDTVAANIKYPFDADGFVKVIGDADKFDVPTKATFQALEKRVKALEAAAGIPAAQDEE